MHSKINTQKNSNNKIEDIVAARIIGQILTDQQSHAFFQDLLLGKVDDIQLTAFLVSGILKPFSPAEIVGAARALKENAVTISADTDALIDCCGTGGDGSHSINISSIAALIAAAQGLKVAKHGNKAVSSSCGSADLYQKLGLNIMLNPKASQQMLAEHNFCFLFAPMYHQGVKHAMKVRQRLKTRTIFNILGPLINPAQPKYQLLGVYDPQVGLTLAKCLAELKMKKAWVVHGAGTDEISLQGTTIVYEVEDGKIKQIELTATDFNLPIVTHDQLQGQDPNYNAKIALEILQGKGADHYNYAIAANVAAMDKICGSPDSLANLAQKALQNIKSGKAYQLLTKLCAYEQSS